MEMLVALLDKEPQALVFFLQILKQYYLWLILRRFHVIDVELLEIADYHPERALGIRQFDGIALCLLEGRQQRPVALGNCLAKILVDGFLLNQNVSWLDVGINETCAAEFDLALERYETHMRFNTIHRLQ